MKKTKYFPDPSLRIMLEKLRQSKLQTPKLSDVIYAAISLFLIAYIISALTNTGFKFYIVRSSSMKPVTNAGDVAIIKLTSADSEIKKGDIIAFQSLELNSIIIHRVINIKTDGYMTKGDANEDPDIQLVDRDKILGVFKFKIPYLGYFFEGIKRITQWSFKETRVGWIFIFTVPVILILMYRGKKHKEPSQN